MNILWILFTKHYDCEGAKKYKKDCFAQHAKWNLFYDFYDFYQISTSNVYKKKKYFFNICIVPCGTI